MLLLSSWKGGHQQEWKMKKNKPKTKCKNGHPQFILLSWSWKNMIIESLMSTWQINPIVPGWYYSVCSAYFTWNDRFIFSLDWQFIFSRINLQRNNWKQRDSLFLVTIHSEHGFFLFHSTLVQDFDLTRMIGTTFRHWKGWIARKEIFSYRS